MELSEDNHRQFFIPRGFAHGFVVLSETAKFQYKCDDFYTPEADGGISIKDESLGIDWGISIEDAILSEKDLKHLCLNTLFCCNKWGWGWDNFLQEANAGKGLKVKNWMKPHFQYVVPAIIIFLYIYGLFTFAWK